MRRLAVTLFALALLAAPLAAGAQPAGKVYRLGILSNSGRSWPSGREALRQGLGELGYQEGRNLIVEYREAEGRVERLPALAKELVILKVDVIIANTTASALAARDATTTIPIVFQAVVDPIGSGLVTSLARPGGNITGFTHITGEIIGKRLDLLKAIAPNASLVMLRNPGNPISAHNLKQTQRAAQSLGVKLKVVEARTPEEISRAFAATVGQRRAALLVDPDGMFTSQRSQIADLAIKHRVPAIFEGRGFVDVGGLISYGASVDKRDRRVAAFVDRILKGVKPADLPVEQPTKYELIINLKTAKALGLTIPPSVLARADEIIQ